MRKVFIRAILSYVFLALVTPTFAAETNGEATLTLDQTIHFLATDGSDVLVQPGTYQLEVAEEWLRLIPGERRDALLLEAYSTQHKEVLRTPQAFLEEEGNAYRLALLLPDGTGLEAIGSVSGIRSRAVRRPLTSRTRTPKQASRIPTQSKNTRGSQKSKPIPKSSTQPNNQLAQRVQTLEQQVSTLLATIDSLQSRLANMEAAIQVSNSGQVTIQGNTVKLSASMVDVQAATSKFSGLVQADSVITNSVISKSYTPGASNIW